MENARLRGVALPFEGLRNWRWASAGVLLLPTAGLVGAPIHANALSGAVALALTAAAAVLARLAGRSRTTMVTGLAALAVGAALLPWASYPGAGLVLAVIVGAGLGPLLPAGRLTKDALLPAVAGAAVVAGLRAAEGVEAAAAGAMLLAATAAVAGPPGRRRPGRAVAAGLASAHAALAFFGVFWIGSTAPSVTWFGALTSHGPRSGSEVAITFDDGPNGAQTLAIAAILEEHGARGTFFEVGKAVKAEPEITRALIARGHTVGNHSYNHGAFSYLDPRYPELQQTQHEIDHEAAVCPRLFRPPHGTHTPFMSRVVTNASMLLVNWDVSARDWVEDDPSALAAHILARAKPGSVILLHDGIDGNTGADRSVVIRALPAIIEGLQAKGLTPVTLDRLLGVSPYLSSCGGS